MANAGTRVAEIKHIDEGIYSKKDQPKCRVVQVTEEIIYSEDPENPVSWPIKIQV
jgi:hypothetical protein